MRVALVTNKLYHHKFWAYMLWKNFDVKLILHPNNANLIERIKSKNLLRKGYRKFAAKVLSFAYNSLFPSSLQNSLSNAEKTFFINYKDKYDQIPEKVKKEVSTVNCPSSVKLIKDNKIDVICFLGGEIAKKDFIDSPRKISLNFHSGFSPFYNGSKTIFHSVSDSKPNYSGGTLMEINEKIDGGNILAHYLPSIGKRDNATSLFMKGIIGSVKLYYVILSSIIRDEPIIGIPQGKPLKYVTNLDWNILTDIQLYKFENSRSIRNFTRKEKIVFYHLNKRKELDLNYLEQLVS